MFDHSYTSHITRWLTHIDKGKKNKQGNGEKKDNKMEWRMKFY